MSELATRTAVGIILIGIALASALFGGTVFAVLVALIAIVAVGAVTFAGTTVSTIFNNIAGAI